MSKMMNAEQAFCAMRFFLERMYELTSSEDIAMLLGGMAILADGSLADPAYWQDWEEAISKVHNEQ